MNPLKDIDDAVDYLKQVQREMEEMYYDSGDEQSIPAIKRDFDNALRSLQETKRVLEKLWSDWDLM